MKKRRTRTNNSTRLPIQSSKLLQESVVFSKSKSFQDLKRRYIRGKIPQKRKCRAKTEGILPLNKNAFDSLETFFDVKKELHVPNITSYINYDHDESSSVLSSTKSSERSVDNEPSELTSIHTANHFHLLQENDNYLKMADTNKIAEEQLSDEDEQDQEHISTTLSSLEAEDDDDDYNDEEEGDIDSLLDELTEIPEETLADDSPELFFHSDPVNINPGSRKNLFSNTLTDCQVFKEMAEASSRSAVIGKEIVQLQQELKQLQQKEEFDDSDKEMLDMKREDLMKKMGEFDVMTKKIGETLGLVDPSNDEFATAYETFIQSQAPEAKDIAQEDKEERLKERVDEWQAWENELPDEKRFDLPQQEYPEERLPRVIVCGYTEDQLPKIVVADSERRSKGNKIQCLESITGKLVEALDVQEKLAKDNAQLESGRYKLEKALIEKDDAVDRLERKVCGLQEEMRMIVKENSELSRQLVASNQRLTYQLCDSPRSAHHSPNTPTQRHTDKSCKCRHFLEEHHSNTVCVRPRDNKGQNRNSPRLGGGGSRENICCNFTSSTNENLAMCCRNSRTIPVLESDGSLLDHTTCPAERETKLTSHYTLSKQLAQNLSTVESVVHNMKMELAKVQREGQQLHQRQKLLSCTAPCAPCPRSPPASGQVSQPTIQLFKAVAPFAQEPQGPKKEYQLTRGSIPSCTGICTNASMGGSNCPLQQLRDLREQYVRLQEDYKNKLTEVSCLRTDADRMKQDTRDAKDAKEKAENRLIDLEERLKIFESKGSRFNGSKEQLMEQEQTLIVAKQRYTDAQDELEELRSAIQDQANRLEDYRNKYLQAQEQVEEQRRQIELMEMDNARMNENVTLEIGRVKNQFQEKLCELAPLPDILKQTQNKLQECHQMRLIAERNCEELTRELLNCKDRIGSMTSQSEILRTENAALKGPDLDNLQDKNRELRNENERLKNALERCEEREIEYQKRIDDKKHEIAQLSSMLEQMREDTARQITRTKERCETVRRRMQGEISAMEKQLAQCRATAKAAQKDQDEIRQKMQGQINHLSEAFNHAQARIKNIQGQVNYLKPGTSNTYCVNGPGDGYLTAMTLDSHQNSCDICDCNY